MRNLFLLLICLIGLLQNTSAQNFAYKAKVTAAPANNYYKIILTDNFSAVANYNFADVRLFDNDGNEIPYLLKTEELNTANKERKNFPFSQVINKNGMQTIIVRNDNKVELNTLELCLANADADRELSISGSDNKQNWYVVQDHFYFTNSGKDNGIEMFRTLNFPNTNYYFYKIEINNAKRKPLQIKSIGQSATKSIDNEMQVVSGFTYTKIDSSDKNTYIHCSINPSNRIDKITFAIASPEMYLRKCEIFSNYKSLQNIEESPTEKSHVEENNFSENFELNSNQNGELMVNYIFENKKCNSFDIVIHNNDNTPLQIKSIVAKQSKSAIIAKLDATKTYYIYAGDSNINAPNYDIVYFEKNIPNQIASLQLGPLLKKTTITKDEYSSKKDKYLVWIGLGIISMILLYLTSNMMKKMNTE
jgi:hypothetical protein